MVRRISQLGGLAALVLASACVLDTSDRRSSSDDDDGGAKKSGGSVATCLDACIAHESDCGAASPQQDCQQICDTYQPLAWQVACAESVACGDQAGLVACMPDLECESRCVAHEQACGDPSPQAGCAQICEQYRPTPGQVACAEAVACGDQQGLAGCMAPP